MQTHIRAVAFTFSIVILFVVIIKRKKGRKREIKKKDPHSFINKQVFNETQNVCITFHIGTDSIILSFVFSIRKKKSQEC